MPTRLAAFSANGSVADRRGGTRPARGYQSVLPPPYRTFVVRAELLVVTVARDDVKPHERTPRETKEADCVTRARIERENAICGSVTDEHKGKRKRVTNCE